MSKNTKRTTAVIGTTLALVLAGTAAVAAHPGDRGDRGWERGGGRMDGQWLPGSRGMEGPGGMGGPGGMRGRGGMVDDLERREVTLQTADGVMTNRVEQGAVESAAADALAFSLASGESVTVAIDEDTELVAFEEQDVTVRGRSRTRLVPTEIEAADIEAGAEVVVWSDAEDGADFVASRVVVESADDAADSSDSVADQDATDDAADETVSEDAGTADA